MKKSLSPLYHKKIFLIVIKRNYGFYVLVSGLALEIFDFLCIILQELLYRMLCLGVLPTSNPTESNL